VRARLIVSVRAGVSALAVLVVVSAATTAVAAELDGLTGLRLVRVNLDVGHPLDPTTADNLVARLVNTLRRADPPITIADTAPDRIVLTVAVRPASATALRGFWLPFSGTYGVGAVRLAVERVVTLPGAPRAFPAFVWQTERIVASPWRETDQEIARLLDEMVAELLEARRRAG